MDYLEIIKNLRTDRDLSQSDVAKVIGVAQRTYADYESGNVRINVDALIKLAAFYDVDMNYISGLSDKKLPFPKKNSIH